ncbi:MAG: hypothetical protein PVJ03_11125 [Chromatiaceae bacterium]
MGFVSTSSTHVESQLWCDTVMYRAKLQAKIREVNMIGRNKPSFVALTVALFIAAAAFSSATYAQIQSLLWGGQICKPVNGAQGLIWNGDGAFNTSNAPLLVVCPLAYDPLSEVSIGATVRVVNRANSQRTVGCVLRINNPDGSLAYREPLTETLLPTQLVLFLFANFPVVDSQTAIAVCNLAPQTGVTTVGVDLVE